MQCFYGKEYGNKGIKILALALREQSKYGKCPNYSFTNNHLNSYTHMHTHTGIVDENEEMKYFISLLFVCI